MYLVFTDNIEEKIVPFLAPNVYKVNLEVVGPLVRVGIWWGRGRGGDEVVYISFCVIIQIPNSVHNSLTPHVLHTYIRTYIHTQSNTI